jgi:uncharacterized membrane protein
MRKEIARPTYLTGIGAAITAAAIAGTAGFILGRLPMLRRYVPVHFSREGLPDRWLESSYALVLMPVWVQLTLALVFAAIAVLLLYRARPDDAHGALPRQDSERLRVAAEAVSLLAAIWVTFQGLAAVRIMRLWQRGFGGLGDIYGQTLVVAIVMSIVVGIRAASHLRQPSVSLRPAVPDGHWRFRRLYFNRQNPALFVPVRSGMGWTLNFGRPGAILLMTIMLMLGLGAPLVIMSFLLGE